MIEARFGLKRRPFDKAIDSRKLYLWPGLEELAARLEMSKQARGILLVTGEPGTGKTVALRRFVDSLNAEHYVTIYLPLATVTAIDAYAQLNRGLGGQDGMHFPPFGSCRWRERGRRAAFRDGRE